MRKVICVASGQINARKANTEVAKKHLYLNYGLLSLASLLKQNGYDSTHIQGNFDAPSETLNACISEGLLETENPIFLSIPTFYALQWAQEFVSVARQVRPNQRFVVGGRWVVGDQPETLSKMLGGVDLVVSGIGENQLASIMAKYLEWSPKLTPVVSRGQLLPQPLNYDILKNRNEYQPSIEVSRGCGMGCNFCQEKDEILLPLKAPKNLIAELVNTVIHDDLRPMTPYLEASIFAPSRSWAQEVMAEYRAHGLTTEWRAEARVDSILPDVLETLAEGGLKVIDLGLESADPQQLLRMNKTKDPERYLARASALLKAAHNTGVLTKVNVLLFAGETADSIARTIEWLEDHRMYVSGVSVGPVMCFGWPDSIASYVNELQSYGAAPVEDKQILGVTKMHLSKQFDFEESIELSKNISRSFMTARQYFALKAFSYLPRSYSFENFMGDVGISTSDFGFSI